MNYAEARVRTSEPRSPRLLMWLCASTMLVLGTISRQPLLALAGLAMILAMVLTALRTILIEAEEPTMLVALRIAVAREKYVSGEITLDEFERAVADALAAEPS
jgi:uncharacterized membrane protein